MANSGLIRKKDVVLDYGCGKGRVDFFLSYQTKAKTLGIEYDERIYHGALENRKTAVSGARTEFVPARAEAYEVPSEVNRFNFFNHFCFFYYLKENGGPHFMLYVRPNYYNKFTCVADRCEATCCAGWQIVIDETALHRYKSEQGEYGEVLRKRIDWEEGVFEQDCRKRCAFLDENNLCEMYRQLGAESLCVTCGNYPRHIEEFENQREITLTVSCPEVARILLEQKEPVSFTEEEIEEDEEEFEDFDPFFFSYLEDARRIIIAILQNRKLSVAVRGFLVHKMSEEMQKIIEESDLFDLADVFEAYEEEANFANAVREAEQDLKTFYENKEEGFLYSKAVFERLYELEFLCEDWEDYLDRCRKTLYGEGAQAYRDMRNRFKEYCMQAPIDGIDMDILLEQLLVYFVFAYFCGAVYDDNVIGKIRMSVDSVTVLYEMFMVKWTEQEGQLSIEDIRRIVYRYSRELEHSDVNLGRMQRNG